MNLHANGSYISLRPLNPLTTAHHYQGCIDLHGQSIPHGLLFAPGPDECQVCTCVNGSAGLCRTVLCAPPHNCQSLRVGDQCCQWICLDDIHPHGGSNFDVSSGGGVGPNSADVKLRLVASAVTAVLSIALLFFLIYRLRKKKLQNRQRRQQHQRQHDDDVSVDSVESARGGFPMTAANTAAASLTTPRSYWQSLAWWKPTPNMFEGRPAPPSYDDAMMQHNTRDPEGECSSLDSNGSEAPPYSEIHLDPVIPESVEWYDRLRQPQTAPVHRMVGTAATLPRPPQSTYVPTGAALVLPVPAPTFSYLNHVSLPRQQQVEQGRCLTVRHPKTFKPDNTRQTHVPSNATLTLQPPRFRRPTNPTDLNLSADPPPPPPISHIRSHTTLPPALRRMRARSREGIVLPPEERDAVLQRFSLQLNLNLSESSGGSSSTVGTVSPEEKRMRSRRKNRSVSGGRTRVPEARSHSSVSSAEPY